MSDRISQSSELDRTVDDHRQELVGGQQENLARRPQRLGPPGPTRGLESPFSPLLACDKYVYQVFLTLHAYNKTGGNMGIRLMQHSLAENTVRNYESRLHSFRKWLGKNGLSASDLDDKLVDRYLEWQFEKGLTASIATSALTAIRHLAKTEYRDLWPREMPLAK